MAIVFAGIFVTMIPALAILTRRAATSSASNAAVAVLLGCGGLSSFLDNAPTYLASPRSPRVLGITELPRPA